MQVCKGNILWEGQENLAQSSLSFDVTLKSNLQYIVFTLFHEQISFPDNFS